MARFYGKIGYGESAEQPVGSGIYKDVITEINYRGDIKREMRKLKDDDAAVVGDISVSNYISVVADKYANDHFHAIKFVEWAGKAWTVSNVEVQAPRLLLTLGTVYNGPRAT